MGAMAMTAPIPFAFICTLSSTLPNRFFVFRELRFPKRFTLQKFPFTSPSLFLI